MQKVLPELYEGHAPITLQYAFHDALEALEECEDGKEEPSVAVEDWQVPISRIFAHMIVCTDLLPSRTRDVLVSSSTRGLFLLPVAYSMPMAPGWLCRSASSA